MRSFTLLSYSLFVAAACTAHPKVAEPLTPERAFGLENGPGPKDAQAATVPKAEPCPEAAPVVVGEDIRGKKGFRILGQVDVMENIKEPEREPWRGLVVADDCFRYSCEIDPQCTKVGGSDRDCFIPTHCLTHTFN